MEYLLEEREEGKTPFKMVEGEVYDAPAFFNPVMVLNRDASIVFAKTLSVDQGRPIRFFEPLAGIGVRALRLMWEIGESIESITINDLGEVSSKLAAHNRHLYDSKHKITQYQREAKALMGELGEKRYKYQIIDLDPFGPPVSFLDSLWPIAQRNSLVSITATDMTALCGVYPDACLRKYGSIPLNNHHTHETAARILIATVVRSAARFDKVAQPIFTLSSDHYVKIFFKINESRGKASSQVKQQAYGATCKICQKITIFQPGDKSPNCHEMEIYGPIWTGSLFQQEWIEKALENLQELQLPSGRRLEKYLTEGLIAENLPFYYAVEFLASYLGINTPSLKLLIQTIENAGYKASKTRFRKQGLRTNMPHKQLLEVLRQIQHPVQHDQS